MVSASGRIIAHRNDDHYFGDVVYNARLWNTRCSVRRQERIWSHNIITSVHFARARIRSKITKARAPMRTSNNGIDMLWSRSVELNDTRYVQSKDTATSTHNSTLCEQTHAHSISANHYNRNWSVWVFRPGPLRYSYDLKRSFSCQVTHI